jgi:hypothetical protein
MQHEIEEEVEIEGLFPKLSTPKTRSQKTHELMKAYGIDKNPQGSLNSKSTLSRYTP